MFHQFQRPLFLLRYGCLGVAVENTIYDKKHYPCSEHLYFFHWVMHGMAVANSRKIQSHAALLNWSIEVTSGQKSDQK